MSEIDQLLDEAEKAVGEAENALLLAGERLEAAKIDRNAIRRIVTRIRGSAPPPIPAAPAVATEWQALTRPEAVLRIMLERGVPLGPAEITEALTAVGRKNETAPVISSTIDKLRIREQARRIGHGKWELTEAGRSAAV